MAQPSRFALGLTLLILTPMTVHASWRFFWLERVCGMHSKRIRSLSLFLAGALCLLAPGGSAYANCEAAILHGITNSFEQCGPNAVAFAWFHGRAVQRTVASFANGAAAGPGGHDSGILQTLTDNMMTEGPGGAANGSYEGNTDFYNIGYDGCLTYPTEGPCKCVNCVPGAINYGVFDYAIGGVDPAAPNVGRVAMVSVDFNQGYASWLLDNAGAPAVDGNACNLDGDANSGNPNPINCTAIPMPIITQFGPAVGGQNITLSIGSTAAIPILDDCLIAEDKATNCPRNLAPGRVVMYKHAACMASAAAGERRVWTYPPQPAAGTLNVAPNWIMYSVEDENLNGFLDAGEDGGNGGTVNNALDPYFIAGTDATSTMIRVPYVPGAIDCIFLALGIGVDNNHFSVNPPTNTIFGEMVILPVVSVNPTPIRAGNGTPVADLVTTITASKSQGKAAVSWETGIEMATVGFNVIGTKKHGGETKLNASLIAAKEGTTGRGAAYSIVFDAGQLKGSSLIFVEIVKTDGSKERFGPASF